MENSRSCENCDVIVHRASMQKHLRSKKQLENEMIILEWLFKEEQARIKNKIKKVFITKTLKHVAREKIEIKDKEVDKELYKKMNIPYYFIVGNLKKGFKTKFESHNNNHASSILTIIPLYPDSIIEARYINKILKEMAYVRLISQKKVESHFFQLAFIRLLKKINEVMKLNYSLF